MIYETAEISIKVRFDGHNWKGTVTAPGGIEIPVEMTELTAEPVIVPIDFTIPFHKTKFNRTFVFKEIGCS